MLSILRGHPDSWIVQAIAGRKELSEELSEAVVDTGDVPGTALVLANEGARLGETALQKIVERARNYPEWHKPVALRKELSLDLARQLTGFVNVSILEVLKKRSDFDAATRQAIAAVVQRRIEYMREGAGQESPGEKVARYAAAGRLTADLVVDALSWHEMEFALLALSALSGIHPAVVRKMVSAGSPKPIVALCWKANVPVRQCVDIQRFAGRLQPRDLMYPKGGTEYPLSPSEIRWQLEFFGVPT
jgi:uncharacterized protein (DUF2336 family)